MYDFTIVYTNTYMYVYNFHSNISIFCLKISQSQSKLLLFEIVEIILISSSVVQIESLEQCQSFDSS